MQSKTKIIEELYQSGKITFDEAMVLANQDVVVPNIKTKETATKEYIAEKTINCFIKQIVDEGYCDEEPEENLAFNSAKCVEAMDANNWEWVGVGVPNEEEFKDELRKSIRIVIDNLIEKYHKGTFDEDGDVYARTECGGIRIEGWIQIEHTGPEEIERLSMTIRPQFILEDKEYDMQNADVKKLL